MMHKAWSCIKEVPYCFARSSLEFQCRTALKFVKFDPDWAFPDCNSSLNSPMATKWCTKLEVAKKRCPIVLQGHLSNLTVTRAEKLKIWIQFEITRPVAAIKSLRFALFLIKYFNYQHCLSVRNKVCFYVYSKDWGQQGLIHCNLVTPYGDIGLGQHWLRWLLPDGTKSLLNQCWLIISDIQ